MLSGEEMGKSKGRFCPCRAYHEIEGECEGMRQRHIPFYTHVAGEKVKEIVTKESPDSQEAI